jgi:hypothetical protein
MFPYVALAKNKAWQPGPYEGVELMVLHKHETTGGLVVLRKCKAGHTIPAHAHPEATEWAYVLAGEWEESDTIYTVGALFFAPERHTSRSAHSAHRSGQPHNFRRTADRRVISSPTTNNSSWLRSKLRVFLQA